MALSYSYVSSNEEKFPSGTQTFETYTALKEWQKDLSSTERKYVISISISGKATDTDASGAFTYFTNVTSIDLTGWDTSNVTDLSYLFNGKSYLTTITGINDIDTSKLQRINYCFGDCKALTSLDLSNWNVSKVGTSSDSDGEYDAWHVFDGCEALTSLNISTWSFAKASNFYLFFGDCKSLTTIDVSNFKPNTNYTRYQCMFQGCTSLKTITGLDKWKMSGNQYIVRMFKDCSSLTSLSGISNWTLTPSLLVSSIYHKYMDEVFSGCSSLTELDLSNWNLTNIDQFEQTFYNCSSLVKIDMTDATTDSSENPKLNEAFYNCSSLTTIYCNNTWTYYQSDDMFYNCTKLPNWDGTVDGTKANPTTGYFTSVSKHTLTFNANGGSVSIASVKLIDDVATVVSLPTPTRSHYEFKGWKVTHVPIMTHTGSMLSSSTNTRYPYSLGSGQTVTDIGFTYRSGKLCPTEGQILTDTFTAKYTFSGTPTGQVRAIMEGQKTDGQYANLTVIYDGVTEVDHQITKNGTNVGNGSDYSATYTCSLGSFHKYYCLCGTRRNSALSEKLTNQAYQYQFFKDLTAGTITHTLQYTKTDTGTYTTTNSHNCAYVYFPGVTNTYTGDSATLTIAQDETLVAQWEQKSYAITYEPNGGTMSGSYATSYYEGNTTTLPTSTNITKGDLTFQGWYLDEALTDGPYTQITSSEFGDRKFYAKWSTGALLCQYTADGVDYEYSCNTFSNLKSTVTQNEDLKEKLTRIVISGKGTDTDASELLSGTTALTYLDLVGLDTTNIVNMSSFFATCGTSDIEYYIEDTFVTSTTTNISGMMAGTSIHPDYNSWDVSNVTNASNTFALTAESTIDIATWNVSKCTDLSSLFDSSSVKIVKLPETLPVSGCNISRMMAANALGFGGQLTTIYCNQDWGAYCATAETVFDGTPNLVGAISWDETKVSSDYANPTTGYFKTYVIPNRLWTKNNGKLKCYEATSLRPTAPYLEIKGQAIKLEASSTTETGLKIKIDDTLYKPVN